jgi:serine protease AprX
MIHHCLSRLILWPLLILLLALGNRLGAAELDPLLVEQLPQIGPLDRLEVVISFRDLDASGAAQLPELAAVGITQGLGFASLPMAGALASRAQIEALAANPAVHSIFLNAPLQYFNQESREISGVNRLQDNPGDFGRVLPYTGMGVTAVINDSGIDATHLDLPFGPHVVENVQGLTNLRALLTLAPVSYLGGQPNTDLNSGHGTHCAGTFGGSGARSDGLYRGVAPGADIVGYGSGAAIAILDALGGLDYALTHQFTFASPIRVVSNSWGSSGPFNPAHPINLASYRLFQRGISVVFAAGNSGPGEDSHNPYAVAPWVISVGAGDKQGRLASFSSRGKRFDSASFTMPDGEVWTYVNEPTVVATGVDVVSVRASTNLAANGLDADLDLAPEHVPFYTMISGTSMATPAVAGIVALMLEANPNLGPAEVRAVLQATATNMPGREAWEVGAGHVNAYAAVAMAAGLRVDYGATVNSLRSFRANAQLEPGASFPFEVLFLPLGESTEQSFQVGPDVAWVNASAVVEANTVALVLTDPDGVRFGSAISIPALDDKVSVSAPGQAGTWTISARGIGSVSGVGLDPLGLTNGYALPGSVDGSVSFLLTAGYDGLDDIAGHPAEGAIQYVVSRRLMDGFNDRRFHPDRNLRRSELAESLVMGAAIRQQLPLAGQPSFGDLGTGNVYYPFAEAAIARGGALRDPTSAQAGVMRLIGGAFKPTQSVTRIDQAYSLVQSLGLEAEALAYGGPVTALFNGQEIVVEDNAQIPPALRGYAQLSLDLGLIAARFSLVQGPFDLFPTIKAHFDPDLAVTRAQHAVAMGRYLDAYHLDR